jgi:hypothetical protein
MANGVLYTVDPTGFVIARNPASGSILARLPLGAPSLGGVSAVGRALYAAVGRGQLGSSQPGSIIAFGDTSRSGRRCRARHE